MSRTKEGYQKYVFDFIKYDIDVVCPKCGKHALVKTEGYSDTRNAQHLIKFVCTDCGHSKLFAERPATYKSMLLGAAVDPFFRIPLWLTADCEGALLWAYNKEHLDCLYQHIEARLRERNGLGTANRSIGSRLPTWMTSAKNRETVLKTIEALRQKK